MNLPISDVQFIEGFVGAFAAVFCFYFLKKQLLLKNNVGIIGGLTFLISWTIRKMFVNTYVKYKAHSSLNETALSVNNLALAFAFFTGMAGYLTATKKINMSVFVIYFVFMIVLYFNN